jgi:hypothetical protein
MERSGSRGTGAFRWSRSGWFGSQFGATLWWIILSVVVFTQRKPLGLVLIAFAVIPNLIGIALWRRRHVLAPYPAIQILVTTCGVFALLSLVSASVAGFSPASLGMPPAWLLLMYPGLMVAFYSRERSARRAAA